MTDAQKLEALIGRAGVSDPGKPHFAHPLQEWRYIEKEKSWVMGDERIGLFEIIFQHSFARALFGEETKETVDSGFTSASMGSELNIDEYRLISLWQFQLMKAVISPNPIDYMYKAVFGENNEKERS